MTFQVGEKIVYPNHGVATVENIGSRPFSGTPERYYLLRLTANCLTVMVPFFWHRRSYWTASRHA